MIEAAGESPWELLHQTLRIRWRNATSQQLLQQVVQRKESRKGRSSLGLISAGEQEGRAQKEEFPCSALWNSYVSQVLAYTGMSQLQIITLITTDKWAIIWMNYAPYREVDGVWIDGKDKRIRLIRARKQFPYEERFSGLEFLCLRKRELHGNTTETNGIVIGIKNMNST